MNHIGAARQDRRSVVAGALAIGGLGLASGRSAAVAAQDEAASSMTFPSTVSVNGHGSVRVQPDTATINVGVDVIRPTLDEAQTEATAQATAIIDAAKASGIADEDIQTTNYSVFVMRDYSDEGNPTDVTGYQISNQVNLTIRDVDTLSDTLGAVVAAGANNIYGITFFVDDPTAAASEARKLAVADARRKAEELADATGLSLGRVLAISEGVVGAQPIFMGNAGGGDMAQRAGGPPIESGTSEIAVDIQVTYELV